VLKRLRKALQRHGGSDTQILGQLSKLFGGTAAPPGLLEWLLRAGLGAADDAGGL